MRRKLYLLLFAAYLLFLLDLVFFAEYFGRTQIGQEYSYNLIPFREIGRFAAMWSVPRYRFAALYNLAGNVAAFLPFGLFLPLLWKRTRHFVTVVLCTLCFSLAIETVQLIFRVGSFDVDDLILNTLGGAAGYLLYFAWALIRRKRG